MATVKPTPNGPYIIEGAQLLDGEGNPVEAPAKMALCRCGHSENKPFCDGHHSKVSFQS